MDADTKLEELARTEETCRGCGNPKTIGLVVCWDCFKYRTDVTPLKYYEGTFPEWLAVIELSRN